MSSSQSPIKEDYIYILDVQVPCISLSHLYVSLKYGVRILSVLLRLTFQMGLLIFSILSHVSLRQKAGRKKKKNRVRILLSQTGQLKTDTHCVPIYDDTSNRILLTKTRGCINPKLDGIHC